MMNQWHMFNFAVQREYEKDGKKAVRQYIYQIEPGSSWEEIQSVLDQFKAEFQEMHQIVLKQEADKKAEELSQQEITPEVVNA